VSFVFETDTIELPTGAWSRTRRRMLHWQGRNLVGFTPGEFRPYLYPVYTPAGFAVTAESPADHPHHTSIWIGADHVHARMPAAAGHEEYTYNFYVNQVFQGRAPGRLIEDMIEGTLVAPDRYRVTQRIRWQGPAEWAAPEGRTILIETRETLVRPSERYNVIEICSTIAPGEWDVTLGPTRHAYFNFRVADPMRGTAGGGLRDDAGRTAAAEITGGTSAWVDYSGPVGGGNIAGVALLPHPQTMRGWWFATDWGVVTTGPFRSNAKALRRGESLSFDACFVVHDGDAASVPLAELYRAYAAGDPA